MVSVYNQQMIAEVLEGVAVGEATLEQALGHYESVYMPARNYAASMNDIHVTFSAKGHVE
jgi:hypothetical protein